MPKEYKRKRLAEFWSHDDRPTKIKKHINSAERWRGKRIIKKQLDELENEHILDEEEQWNREIAEYYDSSPCINCLLDHLVLDRLGQTFARLGIIVITDYMRDRYSCEHTRSTDTASTYNRTF